MRKSPRFTSRFNTLAAAGTAALFVALLVALLVGPSAALAAPTGSVSFYTSMQLDVVEPLIKEIEARYPGLKVDLLYSGAVELEQRLWAENEAGRVRADVVWAANPALFLNLKDAGLLMAYESPEAVHVPDWLKDEDHMFIAGRVHNMGIAYNTRFVREDQVPSTWDEEFLQWGPRAAMARPLLFQPGRRQSLRRLHFIDGRPRVPRHPVLHPGAGRRGAAGRVAQGR